MARELATFLLPRLVVELRAAGGRLPGSDDEALEQRARRAGWCFGVLSAGVGVDLLGARHEEAGLRWVVESVAYACERELRPSAAELPSLRNTPGSRELALVAGWCAYVAASGAGPAIRWRAEGDASLAFALARARPELLDACARLAAGLGPDSALVAEPERLLVRWS